MIEKTIKIPVIEYDSISELTDEDALLAQKAIESAQNAYAPYSGFRVGAALKLENGEIITGNNQENAAYPSGLCAERVAIFWAGAQFKDIPAKAMAVAAFKDGVMTTAPISPCGACRQVLSEYEHRFSQPISIVLLGQNRIIKFKQSTYLLPLGFEPSVL